MKLSDFTLEKQNVAGVGDEPRYEEWKTASKSNQIGIGTKGGKRYQLKLHASSPKWFNTDEEIRKKEAELRACYDEEDKERINSEIASLQKDKAKRDKSDAVADSYLDCKKKLIAELSRTGTPLIVGPADMWKEPISFKGGATYSIEATPWVENVAVGFSSSAPIVFSRDLTEEQRYDIIASLAGTLAKLHARGVIHGDLKLGNLLITRSGGNFEGTLIDFDSAIVLNDLYSGKYPFGVWNLIYGGTHFSPEAYELYEIIFDYCDVDMFNDFNFKKITTKTDIFSLAVTIYEMYHGEVDGNNVMPFRSADGEELDVPMYGAAVAQGYKPDLPDNPAVMPDLLYGMLNWMLAENPDDRPTAQQVSDIFKNRNVKAIPPKYSRIDLTTPWEEDEIQFVEKAGYTVEKIPGKKGRYFVFKSGARTARTAADLVREGLAVRTGEAAVKEEEAEKLKAEAASKERTFWESDGTGTLPQCIRRSGIKQGLYLLTVNGVRKSLNFAMLKAEGFFCPAAEESQPWPCDRGANLKFTTAKKVKRDFDRGPGNYLVGEGISAQRLTAAQLVSGGYVSKGVSFTLHAADAVAYVPNPDGVTPDVASIVRDTLMAKRYKVTYTDGRSEKLDVNQLLAKGFVTKK